MFNSTFTADSPVLVRMTWRVFYRLLKICRVSPLFEQAVQHLWPGRWFRSWNWTISHSHRVKSNQRRAGPLVRFVFSSHQSSEPQGWSGVATLIYPWPSSRWNGLFLARMGVRDPRGASVIGEMSANATVAVTSRSLVWGSYESNQVKSQWLYELHQISLAVMRQVPSTGWARLNRA